MKSLNATTEDFEPPDSLPNVKLVAERALSLLGITDFEVGICLCSERRIRELNMTYRKVDRPTDVLSFGADETHADEQGRVVGDLLIAPETVRRNAEDFDVGFHEEIVRVVVHGLLHLAGYDHNGAALGEPGAEKNEMLRMQERIVDELSEEYCR